jgi:hypothetical protein
MGMLFSVLRDRQFSLRDRQFVTASSKGQTICHREIPAPVIAAVLDRETILHRNGMLYDVRR